MGVEVTVTTEGQVSLDEAILSHLGVQPGGRLEIILKPNGRVELHGTAKKPVLADLRGILARENATPVSLEEMQRAIEDVQLLMRVAVDTNVLIRFLTEDDLVQNEIASGALESSKTIFISTIVLCEAVWVLRRAYKYTPARIEAALSGLISIANVEVDTPAVETGLIFLAAGGDFADGVILYEAKRAKADTLATFDSAFADQGSNFVLDLNRPLPPA